MKSNVLTAGQIPTSCELSFVKTGVCGARPVTHTIEGQPLQESKAINIRLYVCLTHTSWGNTPTSLSEYELEVVS